MSFITVRLLIIIVIIISVAGEGRKYSLCMFCSTSACLYMAQLISDVRQPLSNGVYTAMVLATWTMQWE